MSAAAGGTLALSYGEIDASLSGDATLEKEESTGAAPVNGVPTDSVIIAGTSDSASFQGTLFVDEGSLAVNGTLGSAAAYVDDGTLTVNGALGSATSGVIVGTNSSVATLDGGGTLPGSVIIADSGVLSLGASAGGSAMTIGTLTLNGGTIDDSVGSQDFLAQITGALTINGGTVKTANGGAAGSVPYQVLFQYGWLTSNGGAGFSNLSSPGDLINNLPASSIDVRLSGTPLYWAPSGPGSFGGNGEWDSASGNWLTSPTGGAANWTDGDVAIFEGTGTVTLADGFTAKSAAMVFLGGNYQIVTSGSTTNPGKISEPTGATTILVAVASGLQATISPAVVCGNLVADLPDGTLILNGDESNVANIAVNCTSAGTLQLGDGSSDNLLPGSAAAGSIVFNNSSTAPASLIFDTSTLSSLSASQESYYGISGNATITEDGPGSLTLNKADTNAGGTVVTSGTLVAANPEAIPNGWSLTVGYGAASLFGSAQENQALPPTLPINTREDTGSDSNPPAPTAGLSFVITGTDGQTNFDVPSTGGSYPLIVFALIQDADGQPDPLGNDGLMAAEVGASLTGTLVGSGNAYFKTNASGTPQVRYQPGASATASAPATWGSGNTIGIGASDQTTTAGPVENTLYLGTANVGRRPMASPPHSAPTPTRGPRTTRRTPRWRDIPATRPFPL